MSDFTLSAPMAAPAAKASRRPVNHLLRIAVIAWIILTVVITVKSIVKPMERSVYFSFVAGARDFWNLDEQYGREGFYYGPVFALIMAPFALMPDAVGATLWNWLNIGLFAFALLRFHREIIAPRWPGIDVSAFMLLTLLGSARSLYSAQSNASLVALVMLAVVEIVHRRWWRAALCLALPVHIKVWPLAAGALLAAQYPRKLIVRIAIGVLLFALVPFITHPRSYVVEYYGKWKACLADRQQTAQRWPGYRDGWTLWETTVGPVNKRVYTAVQLGAAAFVLAWCLVHRARENDELATLTGTIALWVGWQMLLGPGSERLTVSILAPFAAWLVLKSYQEKQGRVLATLAFVMIFVLGTGEIERKILHLTPWANAAFPAGVALFCLALVWPHETIKRASAKWGEKDAELVTAKA
jgi:hypothetical protein